MRLIDADALLEKLNKRKVPYRRDIDKAIREMTVYAPIINKPQWIPVAERLPPEEQYVLITQKERYPGQAEEGDFHPVIEACFSDNCWFMSDGEIYFYDEDVVYAWMSLPEPYEPDGVKDEGE